MNEDDREQPHEPGARAHGCVQRLTVALVLVALYLIAFWLGVAWLVSWLATRLG